MEADGGIARIPTGSSRAASLPVLPPVVSASSSGSRAQARRGGGGQAQREAFLQGLLNEDLQNLTKWHGSRPHHEQKRFLRSVDSLYKAFEAADSGQWEAQARSHQAAQQAAEQQAAVGAAAAAAAAARRAAEEDPLNGPPRDTPRAMAPSASEPARKLVRPIEVFEQKKKRNFRSQRAPGEEDPNTLAMWMDGQSMSSQTTATTGSSHYTSLSQKSWTTSGSSSICSEPGTTNQLHYRHHKRGAAANKRRYSGADHSGNLKDGIPNIGYPETERMMTQFKDTFGDAKATAGTNITPGMYQSVIQGNAHPFVAQFLETATPEHTDQFATMLRSLEYLRKVHTRQTTSQARQDLDITENRRLWKPQRQRPVFETAECNLSRVPLGTLKQGRERKKADGDGEASPPPPPPPVNHNPPEPPHCTQESWLGSKPLSPGSVGK